MRNLHVKVLAFALADAGDVKVIRRWLNLAAVAGKAVTIVTVVADNPIGESCHYPDSGKWLVSSPERALIRSAPLDYYDGEE